MTVSFRSFLVFLAGVAAIILCAIVLATQHHLVLSVDLLAWAGVAAGAGLVLSVVPIEVGK